MCTSHDLKGMFALFYMCGQKMKKTKRKKKTKNLAFSEMTFVCQKLTKTAVENTNSIDIKFYMLFCMQSTHTNTEQCHF